MASPLPSAFARPEATCDLLRRWQGALAALLMIQRATRLAQGLAQEPHPPVLRAPEAAAVAAGTSEVAASLRPSRGKLLMWRQHRLL